MTLGADKNYGTRDFVSELRRRRVTHHVAQITKNRPSAIDGSTTRHPGYAFSQRKRKRAEQSFSWMKMIGMLKMVKLRGREKVGWLFTFVGTSYNLIRLQRLQAEAVCDEREGRKGTTKASLGPTLPGRLFTHDLTPSIRSGNENHRQTGFFNELQVLCPA